MPKISVVTAVGQPVETNLLQEAYQSLLDQSDFKDWEWLVQEDSSVSSLKKWAKQDKRISIGCNGVKQGAAGTRNMALSRLTSGLVRNLDADDKLADGSLEAAVEVLKNPEIGFVVGPVLDLLPDGSLEAFDEVIEPGLIDRGTLFKLWQQRNHNGAVHPGGLTARAEHILFLGGWMALAGSEDTALLLSLNEVADGWFLDIPVLEYRKHDNQTTATGWANSQVNREARFSTIERRISSTKHFLAKQPLK